MSNTVRLVGLSGSLRSGSSNTLLLEAAQRLAPDGVTMELVDCIGALPHFSPDADTAPPTSVHALREQIAAADAVVICCPEYVGGIPGAFKNALDWLAGCSALYEKPVALLNASPWSPHVQPALRIVLGMLGARVVDEASAEVPLRGGRLDALGIAGHPEHAPTITAALAALARVAATPQPRS